MTGAMTNMTRHMTRRMTKRVYDYDWLRGCEKQESDYGIMAYIQKHFLHSGEKRSIRDLRFNMTARLLDEHINT